MLLILWTKVDRADAAPNALWRWRLIVRQHGTHLHKN
jgi:hypothetical protein